MKYILYLLLVCLVAIPLAAQEEPIDGQREDSPIEPETANEPAPERGEQNDPVPESGTLRQRDLGDALRNFQPSEEISADNAVSFPVDI